jgi:hypothetical protein
MVFTDYRDLYNSVQWQNDMIKTESSKMRDAYSTDNQRVLYLGNDIQWWTSLSLVFWIIYYILFFAVGYFTFNGTYATRTKVLIIASFLLYPMVILTLEKWIYDVLNFIYVLIIGKAYPKSKEPAPPFSLLDAMPPGYY